VNFSISHTTTYSYSEPTPLGHNETCLAPRNTPWQRCRHNLLAIRPVPTAIQHWTDYFGNRVSYFTVEESHRELSIHAQSEVHVCERTYPAAGSTPAWEDVRDALASPSDAESCNAAMVAFPSRYVKCFPELADYARPSFDPRRPLWDAALDLTHRIYGDFTYDPAATSISTPLREVLANHRGVCQDFAHLEIGCLRSLGLAARYVSGYLMTDPPPGQPKLVGADASHAWVSVFCPAVGWLDLDPTNDLAPSGRHVVLAWGRDYGDVPPIRGLVLGGGCHRINVAVDVAPIADLVK
jgi:transglutaminase-like putative cysteine protease